MSARIDGPRVWWRLAIAEYVALCREDRVFEAWERHGELSEALQSLSADHDADGGAGSDGGQDA